MSSQTVWRTELVALLVGGTLLAACSGAILGTGLHHFGVPGFKSEDSFGLLVLATLSFHGAALVLSFPFLRLHGTNWSALLGIDRPGLLLALATAVLFFLLILPTTWALQATSLAVFKHFHWKTDDQTAVALLMNAKSMVSRIYLIGFAVVIAPVAEELIFRGVLYPYLKQRGLPVMAWLLPSLLFALIHGSAPIFVPLLVLALGLTWLYEKTGRLLANILVHGLFNAVNVIVLLCFAQ